MNQGYCWTYNNYGDDHPEWNPKLMQYLLWAPQRGEKGTPHLQGYVQMKKPMRKATAEKNMECKKRIYIAGQKGSAESAINYIKLDEKETNTGPIVEFGEADMNLGPRPLAAGEMLGVAIEEVKTGVLKNEEAILTAYPTLYAQKGKRDALMKTLEFLKAKKPPPMDEDVDEKSPVMPVLNVMLGYLEKKWEYRKFLWIWCGKGSSGKTVASKKIANMFWTSHKVQFMQPSKRENMGHMVDNEADLILLDIPRSAYAPYGFIEQWRDGIIVSGKYEGCTKFMPAKRYLIVTANYPPDYSKITRGDAVVVCLDEDEQQEPVWHYSREEVKWVNH